MRRFLGMTEELPSSSLRDERSVVIEGASQFAHKKPPGLREISHADSQLLLVATTDQEGEDGPRMTNPDHAATVVTVLADRQPPRNLRYAAALARQGRSHAGRFVTERVAAIQPRRTLALSLRSV
jgi:hypothetical protein